MDAAAEPAAALLTLPLRSHAVSIVKRCRGAARRRTVNFIKILLIIREPETLTVSHNIIVLTREQRMSQKVLVIISTEFDDGGCLKRLTL
jgi:hypothetical protein